MKLTTNGVMAVFCAAVGLSMATGCAAGGLGADRALSAEASAATASLDGRAFSVALVAERGGAPEKIEIAFKRGTLEASDASDQGYTPASYSVRDADGRAVEFEAELRSPAGMRRFKGRVDGDQIVGTVMLVNDGSMPARFTFDGRSMSL